MFSVLMAAVFIATDAIITHRTKQRLPSRAYFLGLLFCAGCGLFFDVLLHRLTV